MVTFSFFKQDLGIVVFVLGYNAPFITPAKFGTTGSYTEVQVVIACTMALDGFLFACRTLLPTIVVWGQVLLSDSLPGIALQLGSSRDCLSFSERSGPELAWPAFPQEQERRIRNEGRVESKPASYY